MSHALLGKFGMYEMEISAERIIAINKLYHPVYLADMIGEQEQTGFLELIYNGWFTKSADHYCYNGGFVASKSFLERIGHSSICKDIPLSSEV